MRGNEPFAELILQTSSRNMYVLRFADEASAEELQNEAPVAVRVVGELFRDQWSGRAFAHLKVRSWEPAVEH